MSQTPENPPADTEPEQDEKPPPNTGQARGDLQVDTEGHTKRFTGPDADD